MFKQLFGKNKKGGFDRNSTTPPQIIIDCVAYLEKNCLQLEGIFRIPGNNTDIKGLKEKYEKGKVPNLAKIKEPHTVSGLLKAYLREMSDGLLTFELYEAWLAAIVIQDYPTRLACLRNVIDMLPPCNREILFQLIQLLHRIATFKEINKMDEKNLSLSLAPSILRPRDDDIGLALQNGPKANKLLATFILEFEYLFMNAEKLTYLEMPPRFYNTLKRGTLTLASSLLAEQQEAAQDANNSSKHPQQVATENKTSSILEMASQSSNKKPKDGDDDDPWADVFDDEEKNEGESSNVNNTQQQTTLEEKSKPSEAENLSNLLIEKLSQVDMSWEKMQEWINKINASSPEGLIKLQHLLDKQLKDLPTDEGEEEWVDSDDENTNNSATTSTNGSSSQLFNDSLNVPAKKDRKFSFREMRRDRKATACGIRENNPRPSTQTSGHTVQQEVIDEKKRKNSQ